MNNCKCTSTVEALSSHYLSPPIGWREKRERQKEANKIRNRLFSIMYDVDHFLKPCLKDIKSSSPAMKVWPLLANQRCGAWYTGTMTKSSCYFKSVDGHVGTWNFSLKRLNLEVFRLARKAGGCWIVDASRSKEMPDSFSRTIPIWAAVLNRVIVRFRKEVAVKDVDKSWDQSLYTPTMISHDERTKILALLDARVEELLASGVILQPHELIQLNKPLRPVWITENTMNNELEVQRLNELVKNYSLIVCVSCGFRSCRPNETSIDFMYSCGAGDDDESWSRGLTPSLFWEKRNVILKLSTHEELEEFIDQISLQVSQEEDDPDSHDGEDRHFHAIGQTELSIGTRRAGKPPECWEFFDAILNVSMLEYDELNSETRLPESQFYLQLPVEEGKRDKTELERWLAVGITFICCHLAQGRRVLVHCAQGRDRSVAVVLAVVVLFCSGDPSTLVCKSEMRQILDFVARWSPEIGSNDADEDGILYKHSGLTKTCIYALMGRSGRDALFEWYRDIFDLAATTTTASLATKGTIRVALQAIQAHRPLASPSRNTLQKLNRFFMSDCAMYDTSTYLSSNSKER